MKYVDYFTIQTKELGYTMTITFDRWGGIKIFKQSVSEIGTNKTETIYLPKDAVFDIANKILKKECCEK